MASFEGTNCRKFNSYILEKPQYIKATYGLSKYYDQHKDLVPADQ